MNIVGDVTGQFTGDAGMVQLTAYTTNDKTAPSATTLLNLNGKSNLAFSNIMFVGGNCESSPRLRRRARTHVHRLRVHPGHQSAQSPLAMQNGVPFPVQLDVQPLPVRANVDHERFHDHNGRRASRNIRVRRPGHVPEQHVHRHGNGYRGQGLSPNGTKFGGGGRFDYCTFIGSSSVGQVDTNSTSTIFPSYVYGCVFISSSNAIASAASNQLIEDYNLISAATPRRRTSLSGRTRS